MRRRFGEVDSDWEITPAQRRALRIVCDHEPVRLSALPEHIRIAPPSATDLVDALEKAGLVRRTADPLDRPATCVEATAVGRERKAVFDGVARTATEGFQASLSQRAAETLDRILRRLGEDMPMRVGLTGGVGSGKSPVSTMPSELGALIGDADKLAHELVEKGSPGLDAVVEAFGPELLTLDGDLDRPAMGAIVLADEAKRRILGGIAQTAVKAVHHTGVRSPDMA